MKKTKVIIPALGILLLSTAASVTGTVAWFSANNKVTATDMKVNAVAESGIVISNGVVPEGATAAVYSYTAAASVGQKTLKPASTADFSTWYQSTSDDPAHPRNVDPNNPQAYEEINETNHYDIAEYRVQHNFWIRSSSPAALSSSSLKINGVTAARSLGDQDLSASLRVGIRIEGDTNKYIYAPVAGFTESYSVAGTTTVAPKASTVVTTSTVTNIPANSVAGIEVNIFVWFEGEDDNCISNNLKASLETLTVQVEFGY